MKYLCLCCGPHIRTGFAAVEPREKKRTKGTRTYFLSAVLGIGTKGVKNAMSNEIEEKYLQKQKCAVSTFCETVHGLFDHVHFSSTPQQTHVGI